MILTIMKNVQYFDKKYEIAIISSKYTTPYRLYQSFKIYIRTKVLKMKLFQY